MNQPDLGELERRIIELTHVVQEVAAVVQDVRDRLPAQLVSIQAAAEHLDVSTRTIRRWISEHRIPFVKLGNVVRIDLTNVREEVRELARRQTRLQR